MSFHGDERLAEYTLYRHDQRTHVYVVFHVQSPPQFRVDEKRHLKDADNSKGDQNPPLTRTTSPNSASVTKGCGTHASLGRLDKGQGVFGKEAGDLIAG